MKRRRAREGGPKVPWFPLCRRTDFMILPGFPISSTSCARNDKNAHGRPPPQRARQAQTGCVFCSVRRQQELRKLGRVNSPLRRQKISSIVRESPERPFRPAVSMRGACRPAARLRRQRSRSFIGYILSPSAPSSTSCFKVSPQVVCALRCGGLRFMWASSAKARRKWRRCSLILQKNQINKKKDSKGRMLTLTLVCPFAFIAIANVKSRKCIIKSRK